MKPVLNLGAWRHLNGAEGGPALRLPAEHLVTHGVVVGMTGSGKTGLCTVLIEEAARAQVPSIVIDVKGDLPNLLLTFPSFEPSQLEPWLELEWAGLSPEQIAGQASELGERRRAALADWHDAKRNPRGARGDGRGDGRRRSAGRGRSISFSTPHFRKGVAACTPRATVQYGGMPDCEVAQCTHPGTSNIYTAAGSQHALCSAHAEIWEGGYRQRRVSHTVRPTTIETSLASYSKWVVRGIRGLEAWRPDGKSCSTLTRRPCIADTA